VGGRCRGDGGRRTRRELWSACPSPDGGKWRKVRGHAFHRLS
jgi:hypothetical protein